MALKPDDLDFISNFDTVWAVILGAVLATAGGFVATQMERMVNKRERERNAALLFGEVLSTADLILGIAKRAHGIGDPYGVVSMRILRAIRREIDVYERNRERLFELPDGALRARIHTTMVRLAMPLDNIFEATHDIERARRENEGDDVIAALKERREADFDFLMETGAKLKPIIALLEPIARHSFDGLSAVAEA